MEPTKTPLHLKVANKNKKTHTHKLTIFFSSKGEELLPKQSML